MYGSLGVEERKREERGGEGRRGEGRRGKGRRGEKRGREERGREGRREWREEGRGGRRWALVLTSCETNTA